MELYLGWFNLKDSAKNGGLKLFNFETKIRALQLSEIKRMSSEEASVWKLLPKHFFNCNNLDRYFSSNHRILSNKEIQLFYKEIHTQFMKYFKQEPTNLLNILNQSIWYNNRIKSGKNYLINNRLENNGISKMKDILDAKCDFIDQ